MTTTEYARKARDAKADYAASIGIDDALISDIVETFYARIREHDLLGPIFATHIADWPRHLVKMKDFWASIAIEAGRFRGNPMLKHIAIGSLERGHFDQWLALFSKTLGDVVPEKEARIFFNERAGRIADSLSMGIEVQRSGLKNVRSTMARETQSC